MENFKSGIRAIFFGERGNIESIKRSNEYNKIVKEVLELDNDFYSAIENDKKVLELYKKLSDKQDELCFEDSYLHFAEGFRLGVLIGLDVAGFVKE